RHYCYVLDVAGTDSVVMALVQRELLSEGAWRRRDAAVAPPGVKPLKVALPGVTACIKIPQRVAIASAHPPVEPGAKAVPFVAKAEVVAKEVATATRADEQAAKQAVARNNIGRRETVVGLQVDATVDADRGKEETAILQGVIPVAGHEYAAARCPAVMRR